MIDTKCDKNVGNMFMPGGGGKKELHKKMETMMNFHNKLTKRCLNPKQRNKTDIKGYLIPPHMHTKFIANDHAFQEGNNHRGVK